MTYIERIRLLIVYHPFLCTVQMVRHFIIISTKLDYLKSTICQILLHKFLSNIAMYITNLKCYISWGDQQNRIVIYILELIDMPFNRNTSFKIQCLRIVYLYPTQCGNPYLIQIICFQHIKIIKFYIFVRCTSYARKTSDKMPVRSKFKNTICRPNIINRAALQYFPISVKQTGIIGFQLHQLVISKNFR